MGGWCGGIGKELRGLRSIDGQLQNSQGDVKYPLGSGVAKQPTHDPWT